MIARPSHLGTFEFVVAASLRAAQLMRGCRPTVEGLHKPSVTAQLEVSEGRIGRLSEGAGECAPLASADAPLDDRRARGHTQGGPDVQPQW
jgi:hypothetical protein